MKKNQQNQIAIIKPVIETKDYERKNQNIELDSFVLNNGIMSTALVTNVELRNGKTTSIVTLFNSSEFSFEDISIGVTTALNRESEFEDSILSKQSALFSIKNSALKLISRFPKVSYE
jgi:hypothetical protein